MEGKIYTKGGDKGETSLIGGRRVPKVHEQIEAYGTVDELNSFIGLIRDQEIGERSKLALGEIQDRLFAMESLLAEDIERPSARPLPRLFPTDVEFLEKEIDFMNESLPSLTNFILPGGHTSASHAHVARTVCRRTERVVLRLSAHHPVDPLIIQYLNRLSDYLFVLARKLVYEHHGEERIWKARH